MAKQPATIFVCQNCGSQSRKWIGQCPDCGEWNTMVEERFRVTAQAAAAAGGFTARYTQTSPVPFADIESQDDSRVESGIVELDRVLGGGIVAGSLVLIGGAPGIGKSTIVIHTDKDGVADRQTFVFNNDKVMTWTVAEGKPAVITFVRD